MGLGPWDLVRLVSVGLGYFKVGLTRWNLVELTWGLVGGTWWDLCGTWLVGLGGTCVGNENWALLMLRQCRPLIRKCVGGPGPPPPPVAGRFKFNFSTFFSFLFPTKQNCGLLIQFKENLVSVMLSGGILFFIIFK